MDTDTDTHVVNKIQQKKTKYQPNWNNIWNLQMVVDVHFSHLYTDTMHTLGASRLKCHESSTLRQAYQRYGLAPSKLLPAKKK